MKQIVILSGKGGTGKTTVSSAFVKLLNNKITIDCDVDAANLFLLLNPKDQKQFEYFGGKKASINLELCSQCGLCESVCRFDAIHDYEINQLSCEGCGFCYRACPDDAIKFTAIKSGSYFECSLQDKSKFYYAILLPGEGNSGKLVSEIKKSALNNVDEKTKWVIVDGPPGIGCPVNASLSGADFVVIVAEPTQSGIHDLKRLVELLKTFSIKSGIVINKYDLNEKITLQITSLAGKENIPVLGYLPFDEDYIEAIKANKTIVEYSSHAAEDIKNIWAKVEFFMDISKN
ncbi:MAG: ATP-binding protein [Melioribacteraceae bacterium]|nr:ATP-binding protein [Melioribacteraceae bacterium]